MSGSDMRPGIDDADVRPSSLLRRLFPQDIIAFETSGPVEAGTLHPGEAQQVERAVPERVREFAAGRACARAALARLRVKNFCLRSGPGRQPLWPDGIVGSIAHTRGYCGAVVADKRRLAAVGIDAERRDALARRLWRVVLTGEERLSLGWAGSARARQTATIFFSAKEAFFKCQYPLTGQWIDFAGVRVVAGSGVFEIHPCTALVLERFAPPPWTGCFAVEGDLVVTGISLPALA